MTTRWLVGVRPRGSLSCDGDVGFWCHGILSFLSENPKIEIPNFLFSFWNGGGMAASSSPALRHLSATNRSHSSLFFDAPHNPVMVILVAFLFLLLLVRHHWFSSPLVTPTCLQHFKGDVIILLLILANGIHMINLLPPPLGEGLSYEALSKDLRPSLDWCPEKGWSVPIPVGDECRQPCARIIIPANSDVTDEVGRHTVRMHSSSSLNLKDYPNRSIARSKQSNSARNGMEINESDNVSSLHMDSSVENLEIASISRIYNEDPAKKSSDRSLYLNSMSSNTIEAAIMDLEELVNRIKWLRDVLNLRVSPLSDTKQSWEFSKHHPSCK
ncbi:hypothetical protein V8G54_000209 (mitochondrion) [Vigna mungo]|uniref:Uncharacterized protein n=1 Tax=Vigna mungo TaxID=3915 RepID=A0AAQ3SE99_VIGMU